MDLDTPEIHGYNPDYGYRVYTDKAIEMCQAAVRPATPLGIEPVPVAPKTKKGGAGRSVAQPAGPSPASDQA
ncbi:hypothetical protein [Mycobacterium sp. NPDC050441]|uniref:hypothetical protein n=1 Tax=Mycobacterium sp. NPDC050441 TaxID=3155403 RepID=UPI0033FC6CF5